MKTAQQIARFVLTLHGLIFVYFREPQATQPSQAASQPAGQSFVTSRALYSEIIIHSQLRWLNKQRKLSVTTHADTAN